MPFAGKISHAFFDKTGTITTDQLVARGIVNGPAVAESNSSDGGAEPRKLKPVHDISAPMACVIGGCHSLLQVALLFCLCCNCFSSFGGVSIVLLHTLPSSRYSASLASSHFCPPVCKVVFCFSLFLHFHPC